MKKRTNSFTRRRPSFSKIVAVYHSSTLIQLLKTYLSTSPQPINILLETIQYYLLCAVKEQNLKVLEQLKDEFLRQLPHHSITEIQQIMDLLEGVYREMVKHELCDLRQYDQWATQRKERLDGRFNLWLYRQRHVPSGNSLEDADK